MTIIQLRFPWGRYYAHPWGINPSRLREPEWPPSPWRFLRALVSAWYRSNPGQSPSDDCRELIEDLSRGLPEIGVGKVTFGQTVHFQPNYGSADKKKQARAEYHPTRHENHFAAVATPVYFRWKELSLPQKQQKQRNLLAALLTNITYFGRADSICFAELCDQLPDEFDIGWCISKDGRKISSTCRDVFCPNPEDFRVTDLWERRADNRPLENTDAPPHLVDRLLATDMKADGARWISYQMPEGWPHRWIVRTPRRSMKKVEVSISEGSKVTHYLQFSLQCRVPIPPKFIVPLSEDFRKKLASQLRKIHGTEATSFALFGHHNDRPEDLTGDHQHAFYLPTGKKHDPNGFLTDLHIWCPYGFTEAEVLVLQRVTRLDWGSGRYPVRSVLIEMSKQPSEDVLFATSNSPPARIWRSTSPFVPPRYFFRGGKNSKVKLKEKDRPEIQLGECLKAAGVSTPGEIRRLPATATVKGDKSNAQAKWDVVRAELGEETPSGAPLVSVPVHRNSSSHTRKMERRVGIFFEIQFDDPVVLPRPSFGHSCHFGLGLFVSVPT